MIGQELLHAFDRPKFGNIGGLYVVNGCCIPGEKSMFTLMELLEFAKRLA